MVDSKHISYTICEEHTLLSLATLLNNNWQQIGSNWDQQVWSNIDLEYVCLDTPISDISMLPRDNNSLKSKYSVLQLRNKRLREENIKERTIDLLERVIPAVHNTNNTINNNNNNNKRIKRNNKQRKALKGESIQLLFVKFAAQYINSNNNIDAVTIADNVINILY